MCLVGTLFGPENVREIEKSRIFITFSRRALLVIIVPEKTKDSQTVTLKGEKCMT